MCGGSDRLAGRVQAAKIVLVQADAGQVAGDSQVEEFRDAQIVCVKVSRSHHVSRHAGEGVNEESISLNRYRAEGPAQVKDRICPARTPSPPGFTAAKWPGSHAGMAVEGSVDGHSAAPGDSVRQVAVHGSHCPGGEALDCLQDSREVPTGKEVDWPAALEFHIRGVKPDLDPFGSVHVSKELDHIAQLQEGIPCAVLRAMSTGGPMVHLAFVDPNDPGDFGDGQRGIADLSDNVGVGLGHRVGGHYNVSFDILDNRFNDMYNTRVKGKGQ